MLVYVFLPGGIFHITPQGERVQTQYSSLKEVQIQTELRKVDQMKLTDHQKEDRLIKKSTLESAKGHKVLMNSKLHIYKL